MRKWVKDVTFRATTTTILLSILEEAIVNWNRIILNKTKGTWEIGKLIGIWCNDNKEVVISKIKELEDQDEIQDKRA